MLGAVLGAVYALIAWALLGELALWQVIIAGVLAAATAIVSGRALDRRAAAMVARMEEDET